MLFCRVGRCGQPAFNFRQFRLQEGRSAPKGCLVEISLCGPGGGIPSPAHTSSGNLAASSTVAPTHSISSRPIASLAISHHRTGVPVADTSSPARHGAFIHGTSLIETRHDVSSFCYWVINVLPLFIGFLLYGWIDRCGLASSAAASSPTFAVAMMSVSATVVIESVGSAFHFQPAGVHQGIGHSVTPGSENPAEGLS